MAQPNSPLPEPLHNDIYVEVLLRLPADERKLLVRFTAVCSRWRAILTDVRVKHDMVCSVACALVCGCPDR